jgi:hypothetical protein
MDVPCNDDGEGGRVRFQMGRDVGKEVSGGEVGGVQGKARAQDAVNVRTTHPQKARVGHPATEKERQEGETR